MKWVYLATAEDQIVAEMWRDLLINGGVPANIRASDTNTFLGVNNYPCRLQVREHDLNRGRELLEQHLGRMPD